MNPPGKDAGCDAFTAFFGSPKGNPEYYQLWRRHLATDIPHDAFPGVLKLDAKLWRLYGNRAFKAAESPVFWTDATGIVTGGDIGHSLPEPGFLEATIALLNRKDNEIPFQVQRSTDAYTSEGPINLYPTGAVVAKYRDAGLDIDRKQFTGIELVPMMNPGSMIDPALQGWPNNAFVPAPGNVDLPGWFFGFDPNVVSSIHIRGFTGSKVQVGFKYKSPDKDFVLYDGASGKPAVGTTLTSKTVNDRKSSGYFGGNETNKNLGNKDQDVPYFIGKFLGDALQVIFLMPCLPNLESTWVPNPFYPIENRSPFRTFTSATTSKTESTPLFTNSLITTGDALNYTRAILLKLSGMFIGPPNNQKVWPCRFMPGRDAVVDNAAYYVKTTKAIDEIFKTAANRYREALEVIDKSIRPGTTRFNNAYSKISGIEQLSTDVHEEVAYAFMQYVRECIQKAKDDASSYMNEIAKGVPPPELAKENRDTLTRIFNQLRNELNSLAPKSPFALTVKGGNVGNVIQTYPIAETPTNSYKIKFAEAFAEIKKLGLDALGGGKTPKALIDEILSRNKRLITPSPVVMPAAGGGRRRTRRAKRIQRGGVEAFGNTHANLYLNAFFGLINTGTAFASKGKQTETATSFYEEAMADLNMIKTVPAIPMKPLEGIDSVVSYIINNGNTTLSDFIQFVKDPTTDMRNIFVVNPPVAVEWKPYDDNEFPPTTDVLSKMREKPAEYVDAVTAAITYITTADPTKLRDETLLNQMRSELGAIREVLNAPATPPTTTEWPELTAVPIFRAARMLVDTAQQARKRAEIAAVAPAPAPAAAPAPAPAADAAAAMNQEAAVDARFKILGNKRPREPDQYVLNTPPQKRRGGNRTRRRRLPKLL